MIRKLLRLAVCALMATASPAGWCGSAVGTSGLYWFDFTGEKHPFTPGSREISTDGLEDGLHTFHALVNDGTALSATHTAWFLKHKAFNEGEKVTCAVFIDGRVFQTHKVEVGASGMLNLNLDMSTVPLGFHTLEMMVSTPSGLPIGGRHGIFLRAPTALQQSTLSGHYFVDGKYMGIAPASANGNEWHLDIDASALGSGLHSITACLASPHGMTSSPRTAWFIKIPQGGEGVSQYTYWLNDNRETMRTVKLDRVHNPFGLIRLLDIPVQPFRSSSYSFAVENGAPALYACNDFSIRFTDPDGRLSTGSRTFTDTRVRVVPSEVTSIASGRTATGSIPANTVKLYKFDAEIGDSINVRLDRASSVEAYAPDATALFKATGADAVANRTFTAHQNGTYYLAVHDIISGSSATVDFERIHKFALLEQEVTRTANRGCFEMKVKGNGFESLKSLVLSGNNVEYPVAQYRVVDNYTLYAMIDLDETEIEIGDYRFKCFYQDNVSTEEVLASSVLTVEQPTAVEIAVEIEAPHIASTPYLAYIKVTNRSNVGVWGIPFNFAARHTGNGGKIEFMDFGIAIDEKYKDSLPVVHQTNDLLNTGVSGSFAQTVIPYLAPGATNIYTLGLTTGPHDHVNVYAWTGKPWSEDIREMKAEDYDMSVITEDFDGNLFTFVEFCKLYYQLVNGIYESPSNTAESTRQFAAAQHRIRRVANAAAGAAKQAVGSAARSSNGAIGTRMAGRQMLLDMTGENEYVQQMQNTDQGMLLVGNDLMAAGDTQNNLIGNAEALNHLMNARNHWQDAVPPRPIPTPAPTPIDCYQSGDPNEIIGYVAPSGSNFMGLGVKTVGYDIEFENDPEIANASASRIVVKSTVDPKSFDLCTLRPQKLILGSKETELPASHHFVKTLDMRPEINSIAELTFDFDSTNGNAVWSLRSLDPLTLEETRYIYDGILPVNDGSGRGTGHLTYAADLLPTLADGAEISAKAVIVFDDNEPISTNVWTNVADYKMPEATVEVQMADDSKSCTVAITGADSGSGIWYYDIYTFMPDDAEWRLVRGQISDECIEYASESGLENAYFLVVPTDNAANRNTTGLLIKLGDADGNGIVDATDVVVIRNYYTGDVQAILPVNADVTRDSSIDAQDALSTINIYLDEDSKTKQTRKLK